MVNPDNKVSRAFLALSGTGDEDSTTSNHSAVSGNKGKGAAATAVGLTSIFGYASTVVSGWGLGEMVDRHKNWDLAFISLIVAAGCGAALFTVALPAKADNYALEK